MNSNEPRWKRWLPWIMYMCGYVTGIAVVHFLATPPPPPPAPPLLEGDPRDQTTINFRHDTQISEAQDSIVYLDDRVNTLRVRVEQLERACDSAPARSADPHAGH